MPPLGQVARKAGQTVALSLIALAFLLSAGLLLTLAAFFLMAPIYGTGQALLILGLVHLAISLLCVAAVLVQRGRRPVAPPARPAVPADGSLLAGIIAAFITGVTQGLSARSERRKRGVGHTS